LWEGVTSAKDPKIEEASSFIWMFWLQDWWREALSKFPIVPRNFEIQIPHQICLICCVGKIFIATQSPLQELFDH
jgi:hypothetical protein